MLDMRFFVFMNVRMVIWVKLSNFTASCRKEKMQSLYISAGAADFEADCVAEPASTDCTKAYSATFFDPSISLVV